MMNDAFKIYLLFPEGDTFIANITSNDKLEVYLKDITDLIDRIDCERGTEIFYEKSNLDFFWKKVEKSVHFRKKVRKSRTKQSNKLRKASAKDWSFGITNSSQDAIFLWNLDKRNIEQNFPNTFKQIVKSIEQEQDKKHLKHLLLNIGNAFPWRKKLIPFILDSWNKDIIPQIICVEYVNDFLTLEAWFETNRTPRKYNFGDNRHIKGHSDFNPNKKSPLLGGEKGKENAATLLKTAIGDAKEKRYLINCDKEHKFYIRFEYEGDNPDNQYHAYHLVKKDNHEDIDENAVRDIPQRIKNLLEIRKKLLSKK